MRILFLDIDGVLIKLYEKKYKKFDKFDDDLIETFKYLLDNAWFWIVISSSWRHNMDNVYQAFRDAWLDCERILWKTTSYTDWWRSTEILLWLDEYHKNCENWKHITRWCAIDDENYDMKTIKRLGKLVKTDSAKWITKEDCDKIISLLNENG